MAKIINISDKLTNENPQIQIGDKLYEVKTGMSSVMKFEELASDNTVGSISKAAAIALGEEAAKELNIADMPSQNIKVLFTAILAAMQDITYEEAAARFQKATGGI